MLNTGASTAATTTSSAFEQQHANKRFKYSTASSIDTSTLSTSSSANDSTSSTTPPLSPSPSSALNLVGNKFNKIANFQQYANQLPLGNNGSKSLYPYANYENYPPAQFSQQQQQQQQPHQQYYNQQYYQNNREAYDLSMQCQQLAAAETNSSYRSSSGSSSGPLTNIINNNNSGSALPLKKRRAIPSEMKDPSYWEKRRKNNESAKRSRDLKRTKDDTLMMRNLYLEQENLQLKTQIAMYEAQIENLSRLAHGLGGHIIGSTNSTHQA